jgi:hypothetical protein
MAAQNFESPADTGTNNVYNYTLIATDADGNTDDQAVAVTVTDVEEASTLTIGNLTDGNVAENVAYTSTTPSLTGAIGAVTYTLGVGADNSLFTVNASTGVVSMAAQNFESPADTGTNNVYNYTLIATDADGNTDDQAVAVTVTNNAPVLNASATPTLGFIDTTVTLSTPLGAVGTLVSALVGTTGIANFSDGDTNTPVGMAITGYDTTKGNLYYSINGGTTWTPWTQSGTNGYGLHLLAVANTRIYFKPLANAIGDPAITFKAWDKSNGVLNGANSAVAATGGSTAYSNVSDTITCTLQVPISFITTSITTTSAMEPTNSLIANFNGDNFMDLSNGNWVAACFQFVRLGTASGVTPAPTDAGINRATTGNYQSAYSNLTASALDFNGDGYADIANSDKNSNVREVIFGNMAGNTTTHDLGGANWTGNMALGATGFVIARGAGDYNGDGYQDLLTASNTGGYAGMLYGNAAGSLAYNSATASAGVTFGAGTAGFAKAGSTDEFSTTTGSAYLGDTNRDGLADVAFGNYLTGEVFVKFGTATQVATEAINATTVAASTGKGFVVRGLSTQMVYGDNWSGMYIALNVASAGDVNGDGYADLLVTNPGSMAAYVIYGKANGSVADINVSTMTIDQGFKVWVSNTAWSFGVNGTGVGDVNGDGYSDVVIGEPNKVSQGGAVIVFGGATGAHYDIDATSSVTSNGWATQLSFAPAQNNVVAMGVGFGSSAGDVNGDGLSDFSISGQVGYTDLSVVYGSTTLTTLSLNSLFVGSSLTGTTAAERLLGSSGNDTLSGAGGADAISTGAGNDTVLIHDAGFLRVDGGLGVDTLKLDATASAINLDFTANGLGGKIYGFENIDLTGGGDNNLKLTVQDVLAQGNTVNTAATAFNEAHLMVVSGNGGDTLTVANSASPGTWSGLALGVADKNALITLGYQFVTGDSYTAYTNGLATLIVDSAVTYQVL